MMGVPHYLIDVADPTEEFDVVRYAHEAKAAISDILSRGKQPILCGGTGFYIQAVTRDIDFSETGSLPKYREELTDYAAQHGNTALHEQLKNIDPVSYETIHPNNLKRVIRALEYYKETGMTISAHNEAERQRETPYDLHFFVLNDDRAVLYDRIDRRVDFMMAEGLYDEVMYLRQMGLTRDMVSMQGLGYKEMLDCMDGKYDLDEAVRILKRDSCHYAKRQITWFSHYAKRQITWFKREKDAVWINRADFGGDSRKIAEFMAKSIGISGGMSD